MTDSRRRSSSTVAPSRTPMTSMPRSLGAATERETRFSAPGRRPSSRVSNTSGARWSRRAFRASCFLRYGGPPGTDLKRAAEIADVRATEEPGYWTGRPRPNRGPGAPGALQGHCPASLLVLAQLVEVDHARVEQAGLVECRPRLLR